MTLSPLAGKHAPQSILVNVPRLVSAYYTNHPEPSDKSQLVEFGTSGHRGSSLNNTFNEDHILAITQAICELRKAKGITGPLSWERIPTRSQNQVSLRQSRCLPQTALT